MININNYLRLVPTDMILILISTLIICLIAKKYFWGHALAYLDKRKKLIADELQKASDARQEGEEFQKLHMEKLKNAKNEARDILDEARKEAKQESNAIIDKARNEAKLTYQKALRDIEQEKASVRKEIRKEITDVAFMAAEQILKDKIDEDSQQKYVNDFIDKAGV